MGRGLTAALFLGAVLFDTLAFLSCNTCLPSWEINHVPIDKPPWSVVNREGNDRFKCPGCGKAVAGASTGQLGARPIPALLQSLAAGLREVSPNVPRRKSVASPVQPHRRYRLHRLCLRPSCRATPIAAAGRRLPCGVYA
jgi:hypothetical protein